LHRVLESPRGCRRSARLAAAAAAACPSVRPVAAVAVPALQLLLLCIKLEEMENVESVSLPANVTYTMTASGAVGRRRGLAVGCHARSIAAVVVSGVPMRGSTRLLLTVL